MNSKWRLLFVGVSLFCSNSDLSAQEEVQPDPETPQTETTGLEPGGEIESQSSASTGGHYTGSGGPTGGGIPNQLNFQTDLITGRFTYSVPIVVAPGRQGAQPTLGLQYNSGGGNGWCGVGWNLDVGFIQRDTRRGVPVKWGATDALAEYDDAKGFVVNFGGVNSLLVPVTATNASPTDFRAEIDRTFLLYK